LQRNALKCSDDREDAASKPNPRATKLTAKDRGEVQPVSRKQRSFKLKLKNPKHSCSATALNCSDDRRGSPPASRIPRNKLTGKTEAEVQRSFAEEQQLRAESQNCRTGVC